MKVKIKDEVLYDHYKDAVEFDDWQDKVRNLVEYSYLGTKEEFTKVINALLNGDDVVLCGPQYEVPLPELVTSDGEIQFLSAEKIHAIEFGFNNGMPVMAKSSVEYSIGNNFFASRKNEKLVQTFGMNQIPEPYRQWAVEVE